MLGGNVHVFQSFRTLVTLTVEFALAAFHLLEILHLFTLAMFNLFATAPLFVLASLHFLSLTAFHLLTTFHLLPSAMLHFLAFASFHRFAFAMLGLLSFLQRSPQASLDFFGHALFHLGPLSLFRVVALTHRIHPTLSRFQNTLVRWNGSNGRGRGSAGTLNVGSRRFRGWVWLDKLGSRSTVSRLGLSQNFLLVGLSFSSLHLSRGVGSIGGLSSIDWLSAIDWLRAFTLGAF